MLMCWRQIYSDLGYAENKIVSLNSFLVYRDFCHLPITFVNSLDPDQV